MPFKFLSIVLSKCNGEERMNKSLKIICILLVALTALYFALHDRPLDKNLVSKIGNHLSLNISVLKEYNHDTIIVDFEKFKKCSNDPTTYFYSDTWNSTIKNKSNHLGFKTILFFNDSLRTMFPEF